ncbi:MAG: hypothetical protein ACE5G2_09995 [Candidatus Krumholzibacteriia bacterium]
MRRLFSLSTFVIAVLTSSQAAAFPLTVHGVDSSCNCLYRIDVDAAGVATTTQIGPLGFGLVASMAVDAGGTIYAVSNSGGGQQQGQLLTIDKTTGAATLVGSGVGVVGGLAIAPVSVPGPLGTLPAGTLFGTRAAAGGSDELIIIDKTTAATTVVGQLNSSLGGLAFRQDGTLFGADLDAMTTGDMLCTIDTASGAVALIGILRPGLDVIGALAFTPAGELLGSDIDPNAPKIFLIDQTNARISHVVPLTGSSPQGMGAISGFVTPVEPFTWGDMKRRYR